MVGMANQIEMAKDVAIRALLELEWPERLIARTLGVDRSAVARRRSPVAGDGSNPASAPSEVPTGSGPPGAALEANWKRGEPGSKRASAATKDQSTRRVGSAHR